MKGFVRIPLKSNDFLMLSTPEFTFWFFFEFTYQILQKAIRALGENESTFQDVQVIFQRFKMDTKSMADLSLV